MEAQIEPGHLPLSSYNKSFEQDAHSEASFMPWRHQELEAEPYNLQHA
jgi:hypothetical protein